MPRRRKTSPEMDALAEKNESVGREAVDFRVSVGQRIQARRRELKMSQSELAASWGYSREMISQIENGRVAFSVGDLPFLARQLIMTIEKIVAPPRDIVALLRTLRSSNGYSADEVWFYFQILSPESQDAFMSTMQAMTRGKKAEMPCPYLAAEPLGHDGDTTSSYLLMRKPRL